MAETELETLSHSNANPTSYRLYIPMPFKKKKNHTFWIVTDRTSMILAQSREILAMHRAGEKKRKKKVMV